MYTHLSKRKSHAQLTFSAEMLGYMNFLSLTPASPRLAKLICTLLQIIPTKN